MYHIYERTGLDTTGQFAILTDDEWVRLSTKERAAHRLRAGGLRTPLEAVVRKVELIAADAPCQRAVLLVG